MISNLAQTKQLPESNQGQRVIIDERVPEVKHEQAPMVIPVSIYYWLGAVVLVVVACMAAATFIANEKKERIKKQAKL